MIIPPKRPPSISPRKNLATRRPVYVLTKPMQREMRPLYNSGKKLLQSMIGMIG